MKTIKVSTSEELLVAIQQLPQPVGIVVLGADGDFKANVIEKMRHKLGGDACFFDLLPDDIELTKASFRYRFITIVLNAERSAMKDIVWQLLYNMRRDDVSSLIGLYVKPKKKPVIKLGPGATLDDHRAASKAARLLRQAEAIEQSEPATSRFDRFLILEESPANK